jgi:septal ring factor EnvC (AmiA/AmiB activator)
VADAPAALPLRPFRGDLPWPVDGSVRRRFGVPASTRGLSSHGLEIAAADGAPVEAIHEGVVAFADTFSGFGNAGLYFEFRIDGQPADPLQWLRRR